MRERARRDSGSPAARTSPMFADWLDGIHRPFRRETEEYVREAGLRVHDYAAAVDSSMAFAFNLFMPFRVWSAGVIEAWLSAELGREVVVASVEFEFHGPTDILAECAGPTPAPDEKFTAADVAMRVRDEDGRRGIVLVEVKLSEGGFTHCGGATSVANRRRDVCASAATFFEEPGACYLRRTRHARRDRRYWDILEGEYGSVRNAVPGYLGERCPFEGDFQQIMRNHVLALGLVQAGEVDFAAFGLVHHPENHHVIEPWDHYREIAAPEASLFRCPADTLVNRGADSGGVWTEWGAYMRSRYMLVGPGEHA